ncbi:MAG: pentapeptide repeat-containing protein [Gemmatimonadetes bacterium]|nr:pentapeptide repeat-containing protein [Gemmatimonadota bacterium]
MKAIWNKIKENPLLSILSVLLIALGAVFLVVIFADCPQWIFNRLGITRTEEPKYEALKFLGIGMGGLLIALQALMSYRRAKAMEDAVEKTEQGQQQDRLKNAIEHLGHESDSVRLGGAYELFHLAEDTEELSQTVLDILCAHIRRTTGESEYREKYKSKPSEEIQSLLTLLFIQEHEVFKGCYINLQESWLNRADLAKAHLKGADLPKAHLQGADLFGAHLQEALLFRAHLQGTDLSNAHLQGANLSDAHLQGAFLFETHLQETDLSNAHLQGADLSDAHLQGANLLRAHLQRANLSNAHLQGANLSNVHLQGAQSQEPDYLSFSQLMEKSIGKESNLSGAIFAGGLNQKDVDSLVKDLPDKEAKELRDELTSHIGKPKSHKLPKDSGAITGSYTKEEAEKWIAEYEQAMSEVPKDDS